MIRDVYSVWRRAAIVSLLGAVVVTASAIACAEPRNGRVSAVAVSAATVGPHHSVEVAGVDPAILRSLDRLAGNDSTWPRLVAVYVDGAAGGARDTTSTDTVTPPIIGRYRVSENRIRFEPRFPFAPGVAYRVEVDTARLASSSRRALGADRLIHRFELPAVVKTPETRVVEVHPSAARLPSNLLRWYVELSAPMEPGNALAHIRLLDESGREVRGAFLALDHELWDPDRRRLTLLLDPGRVKRGVRTNLESGAPLVAGRRYRLVIDREWTDGAGAPLVSGFEHAFETVEADRASPDPAGWDIAVPATGTRSQLRVSFGEPLDNALASHMVAVHDSAGRAVAGAVTVAAGDSVWLFAPSAAWTAGEYTIRVNSALEDVAGNNVTRLFDVDRQAGGTSAEAAAASGPYREVRFRIR
ncbi:MAG TPA: Ig-like domain-containing protein [Gemmatimonadaceae bacterium]|nr:Ig-like domain-containing protein [Gemmatimonadaceae bacterium]